MDKRLLPILIIVAWAILLYLAYQLETVDSGRNFGVKIILTHPDGTTTEIYPDQPTLTTYLGSQEITAITYVLEARAQLVSGEADQVYLDLSNFKVEWTPMRNGQIVNQFQTTLTPTKNSLSIPVDDKWHTIFSKTVDVSEYSSQVSTTENWVVVINHCYPIRYSVNQTHWDTYQFESPLQLQLTVKPDSVYITFTPKTS